MCELFNEVHEIIIIGMEVGQMARNKNRDNRKNNDDLNVENVNNEFASENDAQDLNCDDCVDDKNDK